MQYRDADYHIPRASRLSHTVQTNHVTFLYFFHNDPPTTNIYTPSLHDALPISSVPGEALRRGGKPHHPTPRPRCKSDAGPSESEEHTSELQSHVNLVCRLLLEKKNNEQYRPFFRECLLDTRIDYINSRIHFAPE